MYIPSKSTTKLHQQFRFVFLVNLNLLKLVTNPTTHYLGVVIIYSLKIQRISIQNNRPSQTCASMKAQIRAEP